jgi:hypothetical protein
MPTDNKSDKSGKKERNDHGSRPDPIRIAQDDFGPEGGYEDTLETPNNFDNAGRDQQQIVDDNLTQYTTGHPPRVVPPKNPKKSKDL